MVYHFWALLIAIPTLVAFGLLILMVSRKNSQKRSPFTDPLLRPPGESCRQKLDFLSEQLLSQVLWFVAPLFLAITGLYMPLQFGSYLVLSVLSLAWAVVTSRRLWKIGREIQHYRLGFEGERAVGQELNQVLLLGGRVYHDVQFDGYNIDHVIVAPSGVFAVETKTRRKGLAKNSHKVKYDGQKLIYPEWEDMHGLEQAQRNAKSLSVWISSAVGERIWVEPILTLPGWLIDRQQKGKISVLNPKEIVSFVKSRNEPPVLSAQMIQRISHAVEQKSLIS